MMSTAAVWCSLMVISAGHAATTPLHTSSSTCNMTLHPNTSCTAKAFAWTNASDFASCCMDCSNTAGCLACEWDGSAAGSPRACHLKATPGPFIAQPGTTCGVSKDMPPPPPPRYTPCSYSMLHNLVALAEYQLPTSAAGGIYTAQAKCDADPDCGGWQVPMGAAGKTVLVRYLPPGGGTTSAPEGSLLFTKHCGPWVDPQARPTVWPLPATTSMGNLTAQFAPGFNLTIGPGGPPPSAVLTRALQRYTDLIFDHPASDTSAVTSLHPHASAATTALAGLHVIITGNGTDPLALGVDESYALTVPAQCAGPAPCFAVLHSSTVWGAMRGLETFSQLVRFNFATETYIVPSAPVVITDTPRFSYRGVMIDVARHFFPVSVLQQTVRAMAFAKFNVLHLHLSDDQSFPVVSRAHPVLAAAGAFGPTEMYTLGDLGALAEYARDRGVLVIPEFDTPGHSTAWCAGYPELCPSPDCMSPMDPSANLSYDVIASLAAEVGAACGSGVYHGGGDEVKYDCWESSPRIKAWMAARHYSTPQQAYAAFLAEVAGRVSPATPMFWQDAFERAEPGTPLPADTIIQFYRAGPIADAAARHRVVYADNHAWGLDIHTYTNTWEHYYATDPAAAAGLNASTAGNLIGGEACVWTVTFDASVLATALWPRLLAVSERLWSPAVQTANATANAALQRLMWARCALNARGIPAGSVLGNHIPDPSPLYGSCLLQ